MAAFLIAPEQASVCALAEETGSLPLILPGEVAAHLDSGRQEALFAEAQNRGALSWTTGSGDELIAEHCDEARFLHDSGTGGLIVVTCMRTGP